MNLQSLFRIDGTHETGLTSRQPDLHAKFGGDTGDVSGLFVLVGLAAALLVWRGVKRGEMGG